MARFNPIRSAAISRFLSASGQRFVVYSLLLVVALTPMVAQSATSEWAGDAHGAARLITAIDATGSERRLEAAIEIRLAPGWYTYWRTPGDAGLPATVDWSGSDNFAEADMSWPAPVRKFDSGLNMNVYHDRVVLPVALALARPGAPARLRAELDYAVCNQVCVPSHASLVLALPSGSASQGQDAPLVAAAATHSPKSLTAAGLRLVSATISGDPRAPMLEVTLLSNAEPLLAPDLFIEGLPGETPPEPRVHLDADGRSATLAVPLSPEAASKAVGRSLTFTLADGQRTAAFTAEPVRNEIGRKADVTTEQAQAPGAMEGFWELPVMLGIALLGGLILNLMPCVLPVLSLKLLSLTSYTGVDRRLVQHGLLASAMGVIMSFLTIAAALAGLKAAGAAIGWGIQFQQPWFLAAMALAMTLFTASLWGMLPIRLSGLTAGAARVRSRRPLLDSFLAGTVATLMATSCSAPFVGTAVGFALSRGPADIVLVFLALGLGMAAPLLAVAMMPGAVRLLPRPGPWMRWLQLALGAGLAVTSVWMLFVLSQISGTMVSFIAGASLAGLLGALAMRRGDTGGRLHAGTALVFGLSVIAVLVPALATSPILSTVQPSSHDLQWQAFDPEAIPRHVADGKVVFVDVTATWCLTCKVNEAAVLARDPVAARLRAPDIVAMRADWTRPDARILTYLQSFGRYGAPLNVVYGRAQPAGELLPELLTSSAVLAAMDRVAGQGSGRVATE